VERFAVVIPRFPGYVHTEGFRELAETVHYGLMALGHDSIMTDQVSSPGRRSIVFGSHLLSCSSGLDGNAILYNLEQAGSPSMPSLALLERHTVWDFSRRNVTFFREKGIDVRRVPVGYVPQMTRIVKQVPDIDVLFYGTLSDRRKRVLDRLQTEGWRVHACSAVYGASRDALIARAKIVLNMHYHDAMPIFESVRVAYPLANEVCVVSEDGEESEVFDGAAKVCPYDQISQACVDYLQNDHELRTQARQGFERMRLMDERVILREALAS
jgi:hypothetical protein